LITLAGILEALTGTETAVGRNMMVSEATVDSRQVVPASMFIALPGERVDGHDYIPAAFENGAVIALVQKDTSRQYPTLDLRKGKTDAFLSVPDYPFCILVDDSLKALQDIASFWRKQLNIRVIGITGSVGKSTTKELIAEVLGQRYHTLKSHGNLNNEIGLPLSVLRLGKGHQAAVLEMGFYVPGEITLLCDIARPQVGVITNVGTVHAERAGSQEIIARGKAELVQALPAEGWAILNYDDPFVRPMAGLTPAHVFLYGLDPAADLWADNIEGLGLEGIRFRLHYKNEILHLRVPLIGNHSVHTILRAAAVGLVENLTWQEIVSGLQLGQNQLRMVASYTANGALLLDDSYNASPESTLAALNLLAEMDGNRIAVLGDMLELGPYERNGHEMVGVRAAKVCNQLVLVGERSKITAMAARQAGMDESAVVWIPDSSQAADFLKNHLQEGDTVLIKGSLGMRMSKITSALEAES
jgi:UDP-N-acetylmuramoyl-tripeptide--D-alanyl-D-alanine ligase